MRDPAFNPYRDYPALARKQAERISELEAALRKIADPLADIAESARANGHRLNTPEALLLANDPHYLKEIARAALSQEKKP